MTHACQKGGCQGCLVTACFPCYFQLLLSSQQAQTIPSHAWSTLPASTPRLPPCLQAKGLSGLLKSQPSDWEVLKPSSDLQIDPGYLSEPVSIEFPTDGGLTAYMNYYPPRNKDFSFPTGELPALVSGG